MARELLDQSNVDPVSADYPSGRMRNATGPSSGNGTPIIEEIYGDVIQTFLKGLRDNYFTPNSLPDNVTNGFQLFHSLLAPVMASVGIPVGEETNFGLAATFTSPGSIFAYKDKLYVIDNGVEVKVVSLVDGTAIPGEYFGLLNLSAAKDLYIRDDKCYVTDGTVVKVFDITDGTYLSGENFGSGTLTAARGIAIAGNRVYVVDTSDEIVRTFNRTSGVHISGEDFGSGTLADSPTKIQLGNQDRAYVLDGGTIRVYDVTFGTAKTSENISSLGTVNGMKLYGDRIRIVTSSDRVEAYDINTGNELPAFEWRDDTGGNYEDIEIYNGKVILSETNKLVTPGDGYLHAPTIHSRVE